MSWSEDLDAAWNELEQTPPDEFVARIASIVENSSVPPDVREFQVACAHDSTGRSDLAVLGYERALAAGLNGYSGRRAKIQLASSLRNLGESERSVEILSTESVAVGDGLDDAVIVFLSLALADVGREREAVSKLVKALAQHLPRYSASARRYADALNAPQFAAASRPSREGGPR